MIVIISFVDVHCHALCGVDDGAADEMQMYEMLRYAYQDGIRKVCFTPHYDYDPEEKGTGGAVQTSFSLAEAYCREHFPDMKLVLGNELTYRIGCVESLISGRCRTLAESRYVLVDFLRAREITDIQKGISAIANSGFVPIIAHVERYDCLKGEYREIVRFSEEGALIQINANSLRYGPFSSAGRLVRRLLANRIVDLVASDAHNVASRPPFLSGAYEYVCAKYGQDYAKYLFSINPERVLSNERVR